MSEKGTDPRTEARHSPIPPGSSIPGGKALATYVAQVLVAYQKRHVEPMQQVYDANLEVIRKNKGMVGSYGCMKCGILGKSSRLCQGECGARGCDSCYKTGYCDGCAKKCQYEGCSVSIPTRSGGQAFASSLCRACNGTVCKKHRQYCKGCGCSLCWHPDTQEGAALCVKNHECAEAQEKQLTI